MKFKIFLMLLIAIVGGCSEDKLPTVPIEPVVNALFETDSSLRISVSETMELLERQGYIAEVLMKQDYIFKTLNEGTSVKIYENDRLLSETEWNGMPSQGDTHISDILPKAANSYRFELITNNKIIATGEDVVPHKTDILSVDTVRYYDDNGKARLKFSLQIADQIDVDNYYLLQVKVSREYFLSNGNIYRDRYSPYNYNSDDPIIEYFTYIHGRGSMAIFTDEAFKDGRYSFKGDLDGFDVLSFSDVPVLEYVDFSVMPPESKKEAYERANRHIRFSLLTISKNYYKYMASVMEFYKSKSNPLSENVYVHSNIENGYGIFAGAAMSYIDIVDPVIYFYKNIDLLYP